MFHQYTYLYHVYLGSKRAEQRLHGEEWAWVSTVVYDAGCSTYH